MLYFAVIVPDDEVSHVTSSWQMAGCMYCPGRSDKLSLPPTLIMPLESVYGSSLPRGLDV